MQVIGRMGPIFQGVTARLLEAGAVVVAPSLNKAGLEELQNSLGQPAGLLTVKGTLSHKDGAKELIDMVKYDVGKLHGVVAHGGLDGVYHNEKSIIERDILATRTEDILDELAHVVGNHHHAARVLMPLLDEIAEATPALPSFTLLTGGMEDGNRQHFGAESPVISAMHGLGLALRSSAVTSKVRVNEIRVGMHVNRSDSERMKNPRMRPLSSDLGRLCSYIAESPVDRGRKICVSTNDNLEEVLASYDAFPNSFKIHPPPRRDPAGKSKKWLMHPRSESDRQRKTLGAWDVNFWGKR